MDTTDPKLEVNANLTQYVTTILNLVGPLAQVILPGSGAAIQVAEILTKVTKYFEFGNVVVDELADFAEKLHTIRDELQAAIDAGEGDVNADDWNRVKDSININTSRIEKLLADRNRNK